MSVIGRLDEQVEAVLIRPLSERRVRDAPARDEGETKTPAMPDERAATGAMEDKSKDVKRELPVWLL